MIPASALPTYEGASFNPALKDETVAEAERRLLEGWPWPVSGDDTAREYLNG
jgi:hypothetical protein